MKYVFEYSMSINKSLNNFSYSLPLEICSRLRSKYLFTTVMLHYKITKYDSEPFYSNNKNRFC